MNQLLQERWSWIEGSHTMRLELLNTLTDQDLLFSPGGTNMTLGELCREFGEIEHAYVQSLKTFRQDWSYRNTEPELERSTAQLKAWFAALDSEMKSTLDAMTDEQATQAVDRGGFTMPVGVQLDVYLQALLIFFGKATIFLRAMNKPLPRPIQEWIG